MCNLLRVDHFLSVGETPADGWLIGPTLGEAASHSFKPRNEADRLPHNTSQH